MKLQKVARKMKLFRDSKEKREQWASIVMSSSNGSDVPAEILEEATGKFIEQHCRILYDSMRQALSSKNAETRKSRYELACKCYAELSKV